MERGSKRVSSAKLSPRAFLSKHGDGVAEEDPAVVAQEKEEEEAAAALPGGGVTRVPTMNWLNLTQIATSAKKNLFPSQG